jgi:intracellular multiplication protein IcmP
MAGAPQGGGGGGGQGDNSTGIVWGVAAVFVAIGIIWYMFKAALVRFYLTIKLFEVDFINNLVNYLSSYFTFNDQHFEQVRSAILYARANAGTVHFADVVTLGTVVGDWLRIPFLILLLLLAVLVYVCNNTRNYKRVYNMRELAKLEKVNWPQISPVLHLDLVKTDIDVGPWAMAMTPMQFCKRYKLLEEYRPQPRAGTSRKDWDKLEVKLKRGEANKLFALQLGSLWHSTHALPPHVKALFAVFAARINADSDAAAKLLLQLNQSCRGTLNTSGTEQLIKKHEGTKLVQEIIHSHAYVLTVMCQMLEAAREDGVQASADFLWLKPLDRRLWYCLNTVGRQTPFVEVAGVFAHWVAEKEAARRLIVPMTEEASNALELALKEVVYKKDEV